MESWVLGVEHLRLALQKRMNPDSGEVEGWLMRTTRDLPEAMSTTRREYRLPNPESPT
jgi:hypothetical protein